MAKGFSAEEVEVLKSSLDEGSELAETSKAHPEAAHSKPEPEAAHAEPQEIARPEAPHSKLAETSKAQPEAVHSEQAETSKAQPKAVHSKQAETAKAQPEAVHSEQAETSKAQPEAVHSEPAALGGPAPVSVCSVAETLYVTPTKVLTVESPKTDEAQIDETLEAPDDCDGDSFDVGQYQACVSESIHVVCICIEDTGPPQLNQRKLEGKYFT